MEYYTTMEQRIRSLTQDDITEVWNKHIDPKRFFTAIAGDFKSDDTGGDSSGAK
jgi:predicted Zn-dependent peptidase